MPVSSHEALAVSSLVSSRIFLGAIAWKARLERASRKHDEAFMAAMDLHRRAIDEDAARLTRGLRELRELSAQADAFHALGGRLRKRGEA